ncbi:MAG TPA: hypothetical protein VEF34_11960 [Syntrophobacteraceae bacterium]|nr:hypothetical protein [Syntrophobacteraceae bacterium]
MNLLMGISYLIVVGLEVDELEPNALVAVTVNLYLVPLFRFVMIWASEVDAGLASTPPWRVHGC